MSTGHRILGAGSSWEIEDRIMSVWLIRAKFVVLACRKMVRSNLEDEEHDLFRKIFIDQTFTATI